MNRRQVLRIWIRFNAGLVIYAFGVYLTIHADIGVSPWDVLYFGLMRYIPVGYGTVTAMLSVFILAYSLWKGEKMGFGTLFDGLVCGYYAQFFMWLDLLPVLNHPALKIGVYMLGLFFLAFGAYLAISSGQGCGPKDALHLALARCWSKLSMGMVQFLMMVGAFGAGVLLGGPVGLGSLLSVLFYGLIQQMIFNLFHYEARDTVHMGFRETLQALKTKAD